MAIPQSTANAKPVTPGAANSSNPHKPRATHRGFVPRGLSYAKRRPKLFTKAERQLWSERGRKPAVRSACTVRPTNAVVALRVTRGELALLQLTRRQGAKLRS